MIVDQKAKRLKAISLKYRWFETECSCCGNVFRREKMWKVTRWGINRIPITWCYCQNCMHSAEDVLNEVDTDSCGFGIYGVDDFTCFQKKDYTRMDKAFEAAFHVKSTTRKRVDSRL